MNPPPDSTLADPQRIIADLQRANADLQRKQERHAAERDEALARESAVTEVLQFISASPGDVGPVFQAILRRGTQLCNARFGLLGLYDGDGFRGVAAVGFPPQAAEALSRLRHPPPDTTLHRALETKEPAQVADILVEAAFTPVLIANPSLREARSNLSVPMIKDGAFVGALIMFREVVQPFDDREIALLQNFAAQAVIAMENARLLDDLRTRTDDLQQSLEYQTATSDVLKVISRSTFDLQPVLDTLAETAARLCDAGYGAIFRRDGEVYRVATVFAFSPDTTEAAHKFQAYLEHHPLTVDRGSVTGRTVLAGHAVQVADTASDPEYTINEATSLGKLRTQLGVPLLREGEPIGVIVVARQRVEPFTERQIELVRTFAAQAVIAIENTRLITETREALEQQTATSEVLGVINSSPGDLPPVFDAMLEKAIAHCEATFGTLWTYDGEHMHAAAVLGATPRYTEFLRAAPHSPSPVAHQPLLGGAPVVHIPDVSAHESYHSGSALPNALVDLGGVRTLLAVPLRKDGALLGVFSIYRSEVRPFTDKQIALLQNFAAQAVIAMENARLLGDLRMRTDDLQQSLEYQTATSDVLKVISRSTFDIQPVLDTLVQTAARLCEADKAVLGHINRDGLYHMEALVGFTQGYMDYRARNPIRLDSGTAIGRMAIERQTVHIEDAVADPDYTDEAARSLGGFRTVLSVPLMREDLVIGGLFLARSHVAPFTERQIELVRTFADQAVIAMENARLITETREALEQQTATAEVLGVINASPGDLAPVFDAMLERAMRLCEAAFGTLVTFDGKCFQAVTHRGVPAALVDSLRAPQRPTPGAAFARLVGGEAIVHIADIADDDAYRSGYPGRVAMVDVGGARTAVWVALRKDEVLLGALVIYRREVHPYSDKQIALLQNFAAQAVIAMENARLITETQEALEQQTATAEVLQVINSSPGELAPVFDAMLEKVTRLCEASFGIANTYDGDRFRTAALHGVPEPLAELWLSAAPPPPANSPLARIASGEDVVHIEDFATSPGYLAGEPRPRAMVELGGAHSYVVVALRKDGKLLGTLAAYRQEVRPFTDKQIALLQNFAAQAVIAMENARLITETREALEQQTATAEVLGVINASPGDLGPVFDAMLDKAMRLCGAAFGELQTYNGEHFEMAAIHGLPPRYAEFRMSRTHVYGSGTIPARLLAGERLIQVLDITDEDAYRDGEPNRLALADLGGARTVLAVPLVKDDALLGFIVVYRQEVRSFSDKQIALLENFAQQAVIAMENARLITETREALEQQTATAEILRVISASTTDLQPAFDAIVERTINLCDAEFTAVARYEDGLLKLVATNNLSPDEAAAFHSLFPRPPFRGFIMGRAFVECQPVNVADVLADPGYDQRTREVLQSLTKYRSFLAVPIIREGVAIGVIGCARREVRPFTATQVELVSTFADQAVIAIENARLLGEIQQRQAELRVTFDNMADGVAMFDQTLHLAAWNRNFQELLDLPDELLAERPEFDAYIRYLTERGEFGERTPETEIARLRSRLADHYSFERTRPDGTVVEIRNNPMPDGGVVFIYSDITERKRSEAEIRAARDAAEVAYTELKAAQANLIQAEKMASLGQLTAGIAHEIKNPLNFVNNFATLSVELLDELKEVTEPAVAALGTDKRAEVDETIDMLSGNLEKIAEHGKRADNIVKSMLEHSRGVSGERREVDLNTLVDEALNLAYHGARRTRTSTSPSNAITRRASNLSNWPRRRSPASFSTSLATAFTPPTSGHARTATGRSVPSSPWRPARPKMPSRSGFATMAPASPLRSETSCSSRSSPPSRLARAPG